MMQFHGLHHKMLQIGLLSFLQGGEYWQQKFMQVWPS